MNPPKTDSRSVRMLLAAGVAAAVTGSVLAPAQATAPAPGKPVAQGLLSPLSVAVNDKGHVYYTENFAGKLLVKKPGKAAKVVYTAEGEVGGVSTEGKAVYFIVNSLVMKRTAAGKVRTLADLGAYEAAKNPDRAYTYGAVGITPECAAAWPTGEGAPPPAKYNGIVESHPYATAVDKGVVYVADAASNAVYRIRDGKVRTVAVLPPVEATITQGMVENAGFPECSLGKRFRFEGVPTDVEVADGKLYVTGLPGGPEDGSVPGSLFRVNLAKNKLKRIATGFVSATGVGVADDGNIYVSELFGGKVTRITPKGKKRTFVRTALPSAVEVVGKKLYVTENVLTGLSGQPGDVPAGKVVKYKR